MKVSESGSWTVHAGTALTHEGFTAVTVMSDGTAEWHTAADPAELLVALSAYLGVASVGTEAEVAAAESRGRTSGYAEAVAKIRDELAYHAWAIRRKHVDAWQPTAITDNHREILASYLEASSPSTEEPS